MLQFKCRLAYVRNLPADKHEVERGKRKIIERKHLGLRTRIKRLTRKTICVSPVRLDARRSMIGLFINRYEFGLAI